MGSPRLRSPIAPLLWLCFALTRATAQTVGGVLIDKPSGLPLQRATVVLLDSAAQPHASTLTDTHGQFLLDVPGPGTYRLSFKVDSLDLGLSSVLKLAADEFVQRQFIVEIPREPAYFEFQVSKKVAPMAGNRAPRYPDELRRQNIQGVVLVQFVVDTLGRADMATFKILRYTDPGFASAVREALPAMRFYPASLGGHLVRQVVQMPFQFSLSGGHHE